MIIVQFGLGVCSSRRSVFQQVSVTTCLEDASLGLKLVEAIEK